MLPLIHSWFVLQNDKRDGRGLETRRTEAKDATPVTFDVVYAAGTLTEERQLVAGRVLFVSQPSLRLPVRTFSDAASDATKAVADDVALWKSVFVDRLNCAFDEKRDGRSWVRMFVGRILSVF